MLGFQASGLLLPTCSERIAKMLPLVGTFELCERLTIGKCHWLGFMPQFPGGQGPCCLSLHIPGRGRSRVCFNWPGPRVE